MYTVFEVYNYSYFSVTNVNIGLNHRIFLRINKPLVDKTIKHCYCATDSYLLLFAKR